MSWFRFYSDTIHDRKIRRLSLAHRWLWVTILCLAKDSPKPGHLLLSVDVPVTLEDLADSASITDKQVDSGVKVLEKQRMVYWEDGTLVVTNWDSRQFVSDNSNERVKRHRKRKGNDDVTLHDRFSNDTVTPPEYRVQSTEIKERKKIASAIQNFFPHGLGSAYEQDIFKFMDSGLETELLNIALKAAKEPRVKNKGQYAVGILRDFLNDGITTFAQYEAREAKRQIATGGVNIEHQVSRGPGGRASATTFRKSVTNGKFGRV